MIDLRTEQGLTFRAVSKLPEVKRNGKGPHLATIFRWYQRGIRGTKLEAVRQGGALVTSREAIERFFAKLSGQLPAEDTVTQARTETKRQRDHNRAEKELASAGW